MSILTWLIRKKYNVDIDSLVRENKILQEEKGKSLSRVSSLQNDKEQLCLTIDKAKSQLKNVELELTKEKTNSVELTNSIGKLDKELQTLRETNTKNEKEIVTMKADVVRLNSDIKKKDKSIEDYKRRISDLEKSAEDQPKVIDEASPAPRNDGEFNEIQDQIDLLKRRNEQLELDNAQSKKEIDGLKGKLANKENTIHILESRIKELEAQNGIPPIIIEETPQPPTSPMPPKGEPIVDTTKRTIDTVVDVETGKEIYANEFFKQPEKEIFRMRTELQKAIYLRHPKYVCKYCGQMVKISGRKKERGAAIFFSHFRDSDDCDYKTTTGRTKREIEREKYSKCNEGERHKKIKALLATCLLRTSGVTNVRTEETMPGNHPILNWRRPDVAVSYRGQEIVFELQLSSTFVSVITERDLFYRLNKKFIIWVFNFDDQTEHVNLTNMVVKDVYYNHKLNIFIFDKAAYEESLKRGKLMLKCNWIKPDGSWQYLNVDNSNELGGKFVSLSDLTYSNDYKPFYIDAEKDYFAQNPAFVQRAISIEEENKKILEDLDKRLQEEEVAKKDFNRQIEELKNAFEIELEVKHTQKYLIGHQYGKAGLVTFDGEIKIPFEYDSVEAHRNWIEAKSSNFITLFSKSNYEKVNDGIKYEPIGDDTYRIASYVGEDILWGLMGKRGESITDAKYSQIELWNAEKLFFLVILNGKYGIINQHGVYILNCKYDFIGVLDDHGLSDITINGNKGKINRECSFIDEDSVAIGNSYLKIRLMGDCGIKNCNTNEFVVPCKYDEIGSYRGNIVGIKDSSVKLINVDIKDNCPVHVQYVSRNERKMMIFKVGKREAYMNLRQQQKASKNGLSPNEMTEMYISHINIERDLIYLSATPVKGPEVKGTYDVNDTDIAIGTVVEGTVAHTDRDFIIIKAEKGQTVYIHRSTWGEYAMNKFNKGQTVKVEKTGFDDKHNKHIWKILSVYWPMTSKADSSI